MSRFKEYNRLFYGETIGWFYGKRVIKELTLEEYNVLLSLLVHKKSRLRWSAADRLGKIGNSSAIEPLIQALQDAHWLVRLHAAKALGRIGRHIAIDPLLDIMDDECPYVRRRVVTALVQLNSDRGPQITEALISALSDSDKGVRACAAWGLGDIASPSTVDAVASSARDHDANVSWRAIEALQNIGIHAVGALIQLLDCPDSAIRYRAVKALGKSGDLRAAIPLRAMLDDPSEKVRGRAKVALQQIEHRVSWEKPPSITVKLGHWWQKLRGRY
jgi:HEAT repeat protein